MLESFSIFADKLSNYANIRHRNIPQNTLRCYGY